MTKSTTMRSAHPALPETAVTLLRETVEGYRILIVDDNEAIHDDFRKILGVNSVQSDFTAEEDELFGTTEVAPPRPSFLLDFATQGQAALTLVRNAVLAGSPYSLVFMDVRMPPGWDGIETTVRLWEADPDLQVVICTAYSDYSWEQMILRLGNSDQMLILKKPFDISEVIQLACALTAKWTLLQDSRRNAASLVAAVKARTQELELEMAERKRSENALKFTQFSVDHASDAMFWVAPDSMLTYLNAAACRALDHSWDELRTMSVLDIIPAFRESGWEPFWQALRREGHRTFEATYRTKSGREIPIELTVDFFEYRGRELMCASARDITVRKEIQAELSKARDAALESVRLKGRFLANMSHEIRTPMNGVVGMAELLLHTNLGREQREYLDTIRSSADLLLGIINDILDSARIDSGQLQFEKRDFDLHEIVESSLDVVAPLAGKKKLELAGCVKPDVCPALRGDSGRLKQVLTNMISNAVKFTDDGEVTVEVSYLGECPAGDLLRFEIRDTGMGIGPEFQAQIFEPFHQADGSDTRKHGGTGLGLSICKLIIETMGGELGFESEAGIGSMFWFTLGFERSASGPQPVPPVPGDPQILVVDDNATNRHILQLQLANLQFRSTTVTCGAEALEFLRREAEAGDPVPLAIVDMQMPSMDGLALANAIKADPLIMATRLIILSSLGDQISPAALAAAGVEEYIFKPVKQSRLQISLAAMFIREPRCFSLAPESSPSDRVVQNTTRILLAEDNLVNQKVALLQLKRLGYDADLVANGAEVLTALENSKYDIILMDCQMPLLDGYAATRQIRSRFPNMAVHIIAMTAHAMAGDRERCLEAGMDDHLSKPVSVEQLERSLGRWKQIPGTRSVPQDDELVAVDFACLTEITGSEPAIFRRIVADYLEQAQEILALMVLAIEKRDPQELSRLAHKLGGSSASCGMTCIVPTLAKLERMGAAFQATIASDLQRQASRHLVRIRRSLTAHSQTL
jgi:PAS domain S-box-containing protein